MYAEMEEEIQGSFSIHTFCSLQSRNVYDNTINDFMVDKSFLTWKKLCVSCGKNYVTRCVCCAAEQCV